MPMIRTWKSHHLSFFALNRNPAKGQTLNNIKDKR